MPEKKVTVAIKVDQQFVRLLNAHVGLKYPGAMSGDYDGEMDPSSVLAVVILLEARGATELQVHGAIPHKWRPNIEAVHALRKVEEILPEDDDAPYLDMARKPS